MANEITIYRGDRHSITVTVTDADAAFDLTDYTMTLTCKKNLSDTDAQAQFQVAAVITTPATGIGVITLLPTHTTIEPGNYYYDIQINSGTTLVYTVVTSTLTIGYDITRTAT